MRNRYNTPHLISYHIADYTRISALSQISKIRLYISSFFLTFEVNLVFPSPFRERWFISGFFGTSCLRMTSILMVGTLSLYPPYLLIFFTSPLPSPKQERGKLKFLLLFKEKVRMRLFLRKTSPLPSVLTCSH